MCAKIEFVRAKLFQLTRYLPTQVRMNMNVFLFFNLDEADPWDDSVPPAIAPCRSKQARGKDDPLYQQVVALMLQNLRVSIGQVQRHFKIGYQRVDDMVLDMERAGLVSGVSASGQRHWLGAALDAPP